MTSTVAASTLTVCFTCQDFAGQCADSSTARGKHNFYGPYDKVNTLKPFTVITQFVTSDGTASGTLQEIRRMYKQGNKLIMNPSVTFQDGTINSVNDPYCDATADLFTARGGLQESKSCQAMIS